MGVMKRLATAKMLKTPSTSNKPGWLSREFPARKLRKRTREKKKDENAQGKLF